MQAGNASAADMEKEQKDRLTMKAQREWRAHQQEQLRKNRQLHGGGRASNSTSLTADRLGTAEESHADEQALLARGRLGRIERLRSPRETTGTVVQTLNAREAWTG